MPFFQLLVCQPGVCGLQMHHLTCAIMLACLATVGRTREAMKAMEGTNEHHV